MNKIPQRMCVVTSEKTDKNNLLRIVKDDTGVYVDTIMYKGTDTHLMVPEHFEHDYDTLKNIGVLTFSDSGVQKVYIPEGVETIE